MYTFNTPLPAVRGIGPQLSATLKTAGYETVLDLLLAVPLRYEDRSQFATIADAPEKQLLTIQAKLLKISTRYRGKRSVTTAKIMDKTGTMTVMWFNNRFAQSSLNTGQEYLFSGKVNDRRTMVQPLFEKLTADTVHTGRMIPLYSSTLRMKQGTLRRLLKEIIGNLEIPPDEVVKLLPKNQELIPLKDALSQLHFPEEENKVVQARERLALEELLALIQHSQSLKEAWKKESGAVAIPKQGKLVPNSIPFDLTNAQLRCVEEIMADIGDTTPMNRILIGDVGSGKTVVAGIAAQQTFNNGKNVALVAPTQILAEQHASTMSQLFPEIEIQLLTAKNSKKVANEIDVNQPTMYIGTHAVINKLTHIQPALVIYDEQHRFGVKQRSKGQNLLAPPHILTMTATPIPRTMLLTIFSHLAVSVIDEMPANRIATKTWVMTEKKRADMYRWIAEQISQQGKGHFQTLLVCPFINPSESDGLSDVASTKEKYISVKKSFKNLAEKPVTITQLHGKLKKEEQQKIINQMFDKKIDILITTPIVEVGIDLPQAAVMIVESAERFGLASLHQLRGRVGRAGQQGYCIVFSDTKSMEAKERLKKFSQTTNGQELAEIDLQNRGAGDLFGVEQHGWGTLQFASWTNFELIAAAQQVYQQLPSTWHPAINFVQKEDQLLAN